MLPIALREAACIARGNTVRKAARWNERDARYGDMDRAEKGDINDTR